MDEVVFSRQKLGASWIIGIHGPNKEIVERYHWLYVNHGATLGNIFWLEKSPIKEITGIFSVPVNKLKRAFLSMERIKLEKEMDENGESALNKRDIFKKRQEKKFTQLFCEKIKQGAKKRMDDLIPRTDLYNALKEENMTLRDLKGCYDKSLYH